MRLQATAGLQTLESYADGKADVAFVKTHDVKLPSDLSVIKEP